MASSASDPVVNICSSTACAPPSLDAQLLPTTITANNNLPPKQSASRFVSLDCLRGIAIILMILANYGTGGPFNHSKWDGLSLADVACPLFVFSMGCAMGLTIDRPTPRLKVLSKAAVRTLKLLLLGWYVKDVLGGRFDLDVWRTGTVLGRLGLAYMLTTCSVLACPCATSAAFWGRGADELTAYPTQWLAMGIITSAYLLLISLLRVPSGAPDAPWCPSAYFGPGFRANVTHSDGSHLACSGGATGYLDRLLLGEEHMRATTCVLPPPPYDEPAP